MHQKIILLGRTGKEPETRTLDSGQSVTTLTVATSETYKDKSGEKQTDVEWHNVTLWRNLSDIASKWVKKGDLVYIEGKLKTRTWEKDGVKHYRTDVVADTLRLLGGKSQAEPGKVEESKSEQDDLNHPERDLPF